MIHFRDVNKSYKVGNSRKVILRNGNFTLPWRNIALLGVNGAGKSTLMRLLAGTELPDSGDIIRDVSVSWPLGFSGGFHGSLTGTENLRFICRIYNRSFSEVIEFVRDFTELGAYLDMPVKVYSSGMRSRLAFAISMAVEFDCYLVDEITAVGDARFQERCAREFEKKRATSKVILISHSDSTVREYCDMGCVLVNGRLISYDGIEEALSAYAELLNGNPNMNG